MLCESIFTSLVEEYFAISYPETNLSSLHEQVFKFVLVGAGAIEELFEECPAMVREESLGYELEGMTD